MEFLPTSNELIVKRVVELVPGVLYWAAVDIGLYSNYLRSNKVAAVSKPTIKSNVPPKGILKAPFRKEESYATENIDSNITPQKSRRTSFVEKPIMMTPATTRVVFTDRVFVYRPLGKDFGPLDLPTTYRYIDFLDEQFSLGAVVVHVSDCRKPHLCANSAYLASVYSVVRFGLSPAEVGAKLRPVSSTLIPPFRDASMNTRNTFPLSIEQCCASIQQAVERGWMDWENFDVARFEYLQHVDNGDLNWIFENKFLAFAGPSTDCLDEDGLEVHAPAHYVELFTKMGVTDVVRLNVPNYDASEFSSHGIQHHELLFEDGSCPSVKLVNFFLEIADQAKGPVAVHCKAGLGRSGCMIGLWAMRHMRISAQTFIAWARIARPGSVLGPQQHFLLEMQHMLWNRSSGRILRGTAGLASKGSQSPVGRHGDLGQGSRLLKQKRRAAKVAIPPFAASC